MPAADAIVASLALHHVRTPSAKRRLYSRCWQALAPNGLLINADAQPPADPALRTLARSSWVRHLRDRYSVREAAGFFRAWSREDVYFTLEHERRMLEAAGFRVDVLWHSGAFAVTAGIEPSLGPLATAYVLILVILGPLTARYTEPVALRLTARLGKTQPAGGTPANGEAPLTEPKETVDDQDTVGRS